MEMTTASKKLKIRRKGDALSNSGLYIYDMSGRVNIRLAIVEDNREIAWAWEHLLADNPGIICGGNYANAEEARGPLLSHPPDVVLMDIGLPGVDGIRFTEELKAKIPDTEILICTVLHDQESVFNALKAGAGGYILKSATTSEMLQAIETIFAGGAPIDVQIARKVINFFRPDKARLQSPLTQREEDILGWVAKGYRNREIAVRLHISEETVRTHIRNIYLKLEAGSRIEAVRKYYGGNPI